MSSQTDPQSTPENPLSGHDTYTSPLAARNASEAMLRLWSPRHKFNVWRRVWLAAATAQHLLTRNDPRPLVSAEQLDELRNFVLEGISDAQMARAVELERELKHDVMAHVHCLGEHCPKAKSIIHLGCTSQDVVCNADLVVMMEATELIGLKVIRLLGSLGDAAGKWVALPTLGFTHYQPAQPTTVGRRLAGWASDLLYVHECMDIQLETNRRWRGLRGATGTQASFLQLLGGDSERVDRLEALFFDSFIYGKHMFGIEEELLSDPENEESVDDDDAEIGYFDEDEGAFIVPAGTGTFELTGQTYPRVHDAILLSNLASVAAVLHKIATDIRLLSNRKEIDEPFGSKQIGSSAMPYKRNPMKCERICGLARFVMNLVGNAYDTAATQWLERTLDDSSNRRLSLPEAFLALDGALDLMHEVASGLVVHEAMVRKNLMAELPFLATENILMEAVKAGGDRQELHEVIRVHAQASGMRVKQEGLDNDLLERLKADPNFQGKASGGKLDRDLDWEGLMDPMRYVGRSVHQTQEFLQRIEELKSYHKDDLESLDAPESRV